MWAGFTPPSTVLTAPIQTVVVVMVVVHDAAEFGAGWGVCVGGECTNPPCYTEKSRPPTTPDLALDDKSEGQAAEGWTP